MTKSELLELLREKNRIIAELNTQIDDLQGAAVTSMAVPMDTESSDLVRALKQRIEYLETIVNGHD